MPDPLKKTVSATQVAALFDKSDYETRWTLWHWFAGTGLAQDETSRMSMGKRMQPLVIAAAAEELQIEVEPNEADEYVSRGVVGCTRDALFREPGTGPVALETKCVFDYAIWMQRWDGGKSPPPEYELQLQTQMMVGDGETPYQKGVLAVWVCGEMKYFERMANQRLWEEIENRAAEFLETVSRGTEPEPFGSPLEDELLKSLYPRQTRELVDLRDVDDATDIAEKARLYRWAQAQKSLFTKMEKDLKAQLLGVVKDAAATALPGEVFIDVKASETKASVQTLPADLRQALENVVEGLDDIAAPDADEDLLDELAGPIMDAANWEAVIRRASVSKSITVRGGDDE